MEAIRNTVSGVTGVLAAMSASPSAANRSMAPSRTTPTASPTVGQRFRTPATMGRSERVAVIAMALPPYLCSPPAVPDGRRRR
jgi:hypothetical protein